MSQKSRSNGDGQAEDGVGIEAHGLTRRFGAHLALDGLTLSIRPKRTFGLMGANGAGKTTFIRLVTGFLLPSEGTITVGGFSPSVNPRDVKRHLGFVMETSRLYPELRVQGFLRFMGGSRGLSGPELAAAIERVVDRFQLEKVRKRLIGNLSKGFQQRVSLAQAFLHDPSLVIVDEPTGGLDPVQRGDVQGLLRDLRGDRTVLLCTHDLDEARQLADEVAVLHAGKLVAHGPATEILDSDDPLAIFRTREAAAH
jgi:ABC-2 type transport system ATP-binding protein